MPKRRRTPDSDVSATEMPADYDTVFIDTSLGTHLVLSVSSTDTVLDFKKKLVLEHMRCFPETGEIEIRSLKVKRGENFYHLPDVLVVAGVFHRVEGDRFLAADCCSSNPTCYLNQRSLDPGLGDALEIDVRSKICHVGGVHTPLMPLLDGATEKTVVPEMTDGFNVEKYFKEVALFQGNSSLNSNESREKKKRKLGHNEDVTQRSNVGEIVNGSHTSPVERADFGTTMVNAIKVRENVIGYAQQDNLINKFSELAGVRNDQPIHGVAFEGTADIKKKDTLMESVFPNDSVAGKFQDTYGSNIPTDGKKRKKSNNKGVGMCAPATEKKNFDNFQLIFFSDASKEDIVLGSGKPDSVTQKSENEPGKDVLVQHEITGESNHSARVADTSDKVQDTEAGGRKRKKSKKKAARIQDTSDVEDETREGEFNEPKASNIEEKEDGNQHSLGPNLEGMHAPATTEKNIENSQVIVASDGGKDGNQQSLGPNLEGMHAPATTEKNIENSQVIVASDGGKDGNQQSLGPNLEGMHDPATTEKNIENSQVIVASDRGKVDTTLESEMPESLNHKSGTELDKIVPTEHLEGIRKLYPSGRVVDTHERMQDTKSYGKKRKKSKKKGPRIQDASDVQNETREGEFNELKACMIEEKEDGNRQSLGPNLEGMHAPATTENNIENSQIIVASDGGKVDSTLESEKTESLNDKSGTELDKIVSTEHLEGIRKLDPSGKVVDTHEWMQDTKSDGKKRKKSKKKGPRIQDASDVEDETREGELNEPKACNIEEKENGNQQPLGPNLEGMHAPATTEKNIETSQIIVASDERKVDTTLESEKPQSLNHKFETEIDKVVPTEHLEGIRELDTSGRVVDTHERMQDTKSDGKKRKKSKKKGPRIQDVSYVEDETRKGESNEPCTEACNTKEKEDGGQPSLVHNEEVVLGSYSKTSDCIDAELSHRETGSLPDLSQKSILGEEKILSSTREGEVEEKSAGVSQKKSSLEQTDKGNTTPSALLISDIPEDNAKPESKVYSRRQEVQLKPPALSLEDEKLPSANDIDSNIVVSVTEQTLEDVGTEKKGLDAVEENPILAHNQVEVMKECPRKRDKKGKKKRKKTGLTASDVQENLSIKDKKISGEIPLTEEDLTSSLNIGRQHAHAASSQVTPDKREENVETEHNPSAQGINFRQYFVHDQNQQKHTSNDNVNESSKSSSEMKTRKNVKEKAPSTELRKSIRLSNRQESDMKSESGRGDNDPLLKSGENAVTQKHSEILPVSSFTGEKNRSLAKSNTERSEPFSENGEDKRVMKTPRAKSLLGKSGTMKAPQNKGILAKSGAKYQDSGRGNSIKKISMKTPQKKNLLNKSGSIFEGNSDDDSGDDNGSIHPVATTRTPSDTSSQSDDSGWESELSQNSDGTRDGKGKSAGGLATSKFDLSEDFSIKTILRSSKQFKKAKLQASQSEPELDELLLDTQPYP